MSAHCQISQTELLDGAAESGEGTDATARDPSHGAEPDRDRGDGSARERAGRQGGRRGVRSHGREGRQRQDERRRRKHHPAAEIHDGAPDSDAPQM
jgi:hypothetical protein